MWQEYITASLSICAMWCERDICNVNMNWWLHEGTYSHLLAICFCGIPQLHVVQWLWNGKCWNNLLNILPWKLRLSYHHGICYQCTLNVSGSQFTWDLLLMTPSCPVWLLKSERDMCWLHLWDAIVTLQFIVVLPATIEVSQSSELRHCYKAHLFFPDNPDIDDQRFRFSLMMNHSWVCCVP